MHANSYQIMLAIVADKLRFYPSNTVNTKRLCTTKALELARAYPYLLSAFQSATAHAKKTVIATGVLVCVPLSGDK